MSGYESSRRQFTGLWRPIASLSQSERDLLKEAEWSYYGVSVDCEDATRAALDQAIKLWADVASLRESDREEEWLDPQWPFPDDTAQAIAQALAASEKMVRLKSLADAVNDLASPIIHALEMTDEYVDSVAPLGQLAVQLVDSKPKAGTSASLHDLTLAWGQRCEAAESAYRSVLEGVEASRTILEEFDENADRPPSQPEIDRAWGEWADAKVEYERTRSAASRLWAQALIDGDIDGAVELDEIVDEALQSEDDAYYDAESAEEEREEHEENAWELRRDLEEGVGEALEKANRYREEVADVYQRLRSIEEESESQTEEAGNA